MINRSKLANQTVVHSRFNTFKGSPANFPHIGTYWPWPRISTMLDWRHPASYATWRHLGHKTHYFHWTGATALIFQFTSGSYKTLTFSKTQLLPIRGSWFPSHLGISTFQHNIFPNQDFSKRKDSYKSNNCLFNHFNNMIMFFSNQYNNMNHISKKYELILGNFRDQIKHLQYNAKESTLGN